MPVVTPASLQPGTRALRMMSARPWCRLQRRLASALFHDPAV